MTQPTCDSSVLYMRHILPVSNKRVALQLAGGDCALPRSVVFPDRWCKIKVRSGGVRRRVYMPSTEIKDRSVDIPRAK